MATSTTRLGLSKPDGADVVDIAVLNANADKLDVAAGAFVCTSSTRPSTPWNGQIIYETDTNTSLVYKSSTSIWIPVGGSTVSTTAPTVASTGDLWWDSDTGRLYIYYTDANSSQWVAASNSSTNTVGLVPIVPPTVSISGGTATANTAGLVTFSGATSISLNSVFTSSYANYRVIFKAIPASGSVTISFRTRTLGTDYSTAGYSYTGAQSSSTGLANIYTVAGTAMTAVIGYGTVPSLVVMDIANPQVASPTTFSYVSNGHNGAGNGSLHAAGNINANNQFDGITFYAQSSTITGDIQVFGYNS